MGKGTGKSGSRNSPTATNKQKSEFLGNSETAGHLYETYDSTDEIAEWMQSRYSIDEGEAYPMAKAVDEYTSYNYEEIREAAYNNNTDSQYYPMSQELEKYIAMAPKYYEQGPLYRGFKVSEEEAESIINTLSNGGIIDMRGMSSWSSSRNIAERFADTGFSNKKSIVLHLPEGTKAGTSISHMSQFHSEDEVLISMKARYSASKITFDPALNRYDIDVVETVVR